MAATQLSLSTPKRLNHLPLVMDVYRRCGLATVIDHAIGVDPRSNVSTAQAVGVMLCGVYAGAHSLWRLRERLDPYDLATVMQDPTFTLDHFPEERLAKALDDLYACGLDRLMTGIGLQAIEQFRLDTSFLHFDTTSLSFHGAYESEDPFAGLDGMPPPPRILRGHSKAHRPDLKQLLFGALVTNDGGVPLWSKALDGNTADSAAAELFFGRIRSLVAAPTEVCCVADSKGWCARVLQVVQENRLRLLSRLPRTHRLHRTILARPWRGAVTLTLPRRPGQKSPDRYDYIASDETERLTGFDADQKPIVLEVPVRVVRAFSTALLRTKMKTLDRTRAREATQAKRQFRDWQDVAYACASDAQRAAQRHCTQAEYVSCNIRATVVHHEGPAKRGRGRPRKRPEPALAAQEHWRVQYATVPVSEATIRSRLHEQASFVLIRTRDDAWTISDEEMILRYKGQQHVEQGFSWLKNEAAINPMFLETPHRMAALCFVYCIGLMIWNLIQRTVRKNLTEWGTGLPYHRNKPSNRITTRFLFELFRNVQTQEVTLGGGECVDYLHGFTDVQQMATRAAGAAESAFRPVRRSG